MDEIIAMGGQVGREESERTGIGDAPVPDLEALVAEIGMSYPLVSYAAQIDDEDDAEAMDSMILAGLVSP